MIVGKVEICILDWDYFKTKEYQAKRDVGPHGTIASCYVASEEGKNFSLHMHNKSPVNSYYLKARFDGRPIFSRVLQKNTLKLQHGAPTGKDTDQQFLFSKLKTVEDDAIKPSQLEGIDLKALGTIELQLYRITNAKLRKEPAPAPLPKKYLEVDAVNERSKKAGTHCVSFGPTRKTLRPRTSHWAFEMIDPDDKPSITFRFRYRSKDVLQAQGIILQEPKKAHSHPPVPPSPAPRMRREATYVFAEGPKPAPAPKRARSPASAASTETRKRARVENWRQGLPSVKSEVLPKKLMTPPSSENDDDESLNNEDPTTETDSVLNDLYLDVLNDVLNDDDELSSMSSLSSLSSLSSMSSLSDASATLSEVQIQRQISELKIRLYEKKLNRVTARLQELEARHQTQLADMETR